MAQIWTPKNISQPEREIAEAILGDVIVLKDERGFSWDGFYARGNGYVVRRFNTFMLPSGQFIYQGPVLRVIPHPEGPIIEIEAGRFLQETTIHDAPEGVGALLPKHSSCINRTGGMLTVLSGSPGSVSVDFTKLTGFKEYDYIEAHLRGLLVGVGNTVYLAVTEPIRKSADVRC